MGPRVALFVIAAGWVGLTMGCGEGEKPRPIPTFTPPPRTEADRLIVKERSQGEGKKMPPANPKKEVTTESGLKYEDLVEGKGIAVQAGDSIEVHYTGWLANGTEFDSSLDRGKPFPVRVKAGLMIKGFDEGVMGMKVGGIRRLTIPPKLGYGEGGMPPKIPPDAELVFEVELLKIK